VIFLPRPPTCPAAAPVTRIGSLWWLIVTFWLLAADGDERMHEKVDGRVEGEWRDGGWRGGWRG